MNVTKCITAVLVAFMTSPAMAGVTGLNCTSSTGDLKVKFEDRLVAKQYIPVDQRLIQVSWGEGNRPLDNLVAYLTEDFTNKIDFVIFQPSDSVQNFHLVVKGDRYEISRFVAGEMPTLLEAGQINCRIESDN